MTTSRREQILAALYSELEGTVDVGTRIYRSRVEAFSREEAPAIVIEPARDPARTYSNCKLDWTLDVLVAIYTRGSNADQLADPIAVDVHSRLMADRTIGGLAIDIVPIDTVWERDKGDLTSLWLVATYQVRYRTKDDDLTAS